MRFRNVLMLDVLIVLMWAGTGHAGLVTYVTPPSSTTSGGPVSAQADITTGLNSISVSLTNLLSGGQAGPSYDDAQEISAVFFTLSNAPSSPVNVDSTDTGTLRTFTSSSAFTDATGTLGRWTLTSSGANLSLDALGGGQPDQLIIGPQGTGYNVNASVRTKNPSIAVTGNFSFSVLGVTANTTVSNVVFRFGTNPSSNRVTGVPSVTSVPEPSTLVTGSMAGLLGLGLAWRRKRAIA